MQGAYNVRDLGGYPGADGRTTRWGRFYRADGLHALTAADQQAIVDSGIRRVIDLRHAQELSVSRNVFAESDRVAYYNVDLINPSTAASAPIRNLAELYVGILDNGHSSLRAIFGLLSEEGDEPALFHCTAGKDRTGIVAGLLLDLAGVPHDHIADDYAMTAENIAPMMEQLRSGRPAMIDAEAYEKFLGCDRGNMLETLEHLRTRYGGGEGYLLEIGLEPDRVQRLKANLLG